jgi:hypothetical protein
MTKWNAIFTASGGIVVITVEAEDDESAVFVALEKALEQFGWDLSDFNVDVLPAYDSDSLL